MGHPEVKGTTPDWDEWLQRARRGDEEAMGRLVEETQRPLFRFLVFLCGDRTLAQDICQDTYVYALEHLGELRQPAAFRRWLYQIARHKLLDHRKLRANQPHRELEEETDPGPSGAGDQELTLQIQRVLGDLEEADRIVLLLVDMEGHSYTEASEIIGISESAVRSRLHRARKAFGVRYFKE